MRLSPASVAAPVLAAALAALAFAAPAGAGGSLSFDMPVLTWPQPAHPATQGCADPAGLSVAACPSH